MEIKNIQNQQTFAARPVNIDYKGLHDLNVLNEVLEILPSLKKLGNDEMTVSFYSTQKGNVGIYCEEKFVPKDGFLSGILGKTVAKGDGFVYKNEFDNIKQKLSVALDYAVNKCLDSVNGRFIAKEKQYYNKKEIAKKITADNKKNERLLSLLH